MKIAVNFLRNPSSGQTDRYNEQTPEQRQQHCISVIECLEVDYMNYEPETKNKRSIRHRIMCTQTKATCYVIALL